jgi:hypothetical protein
MSRHPLRKAAILRAGLPACAIAVIAAAVAADEPDRPKPADPAVYDIERTSDDLGHWAFQPVVPVTPPVPDRDAGWVRNPIDAFVLEKLHEKGLNPSPPADDRTWLRRVSFDLIGLPPTPEQLDAFLSDRSADRRERVVDRLLADPGYGVRWGRHWLDVVRYADTNGYERDGNKPHAWRYRDYVVDSLNADKPFDRFLTEQLAGDEVEQASAESMIATTFLRLGTWDDEPADPVVDRYDQLDDIVGTVSATFLGMTLRCARCHNHKFEPLSQIDYARMLAIFEPLKRPQNGRTDLDVPVGTAEEISTERAAAARREAALKTLREQVQALDDVVRERYFAAGRTKLAAEAFAAHKLSEKERSDEQKRLVKETQKQLDEELAQVRTVNEAQEGDAFAAAMKAIESAPTGALPRAYIWQEAAGPPSATQVFRRGNPATPAGAVDPGYPGVLVSSATPFLAPATEAPTSLRRLSLARWMTGPKNPLVPRVIVNRLWQGHFGDGLVTTENDFGVVGSSPSSPALLDWLANELLSPSLDPADRAMSPPLSKGGQGGSRGSAAGNQEPQASNKSEIRIPKSEFPATPPDPPLQRGQDPRAWRLKRIHRLIVLSNTYAQSSDFREEAANADVDNARLWRFPYRRLDAEAVRDAVLAVNGRLNVKMGGPGVYPKIARAVLEGQSRPGDGWGKFDEREAARRSIYVFVKRSLLVPEMELLDFADTNTSCEQRPVSTIPTQALTLLNGEFLNEEARRFAARLIRDAGSDQSAQINRAYRLALCRSPTAEERSAALAFLDRQTARIAEEDRARLEAPPRNTPQVALEALCLVLYNLNEFVYVD